MSTTIDAIHSYWFGTLDERGLSDADHRRLWFSASDATDDYLRQHYGAALAQALAGELDDWAETDRGLVALLVLLDQFSRNIHRGTAAAFAGDPAALALAQQAIASGRYQRLPANHQVFLYMPLEHCENLDVQ